MVMTTKERQSTTTCPHCAEAEAARDAAVAEAAARQEVIEHLHDLLAPDQNGDYVTLTASLCEEAHKIVLAVREPSAAVAALEAELERLRALADCVPEITALLREIANTLEYDCDSSWAPKEAIEARALAARIEAAQERETGKGEK